MTDKLIADLAAKLGTTADHVWAILVAGMFAEGLTAAIFAVISIALVVWAIRRIGPTYNADDAYELDTVGLLCMYVAVVVVFGIAGLINLYNAIMYLCVPEYMALSTILQLLKH